jgi:hypothetical protein
VLVAYPEHSAAMPGTEIKEGRHPVPLRTHLGEDERNRWFEDSPLDKAAQIWDARTGGPIGKKLQHGRGPDGRGAVAVGFA